MKSQPLLPAPLKRRRGPRVAVLALVLCSLLVPFAFLFDRAPSGTSLPLNAGGRPAPRITAFAAGSGGPAVVPLRRALTAMPYFPIAVRCRVRDDGGAAPTGSALFVCLTPYYRFA